jgi:outer membrane lipoprotein-sorting protein
MRAPVIVTLAASVLAATATPSYADPGQAIIAKMQATWDTINSYECRVTVHETLGSRVQDRVYLVRFVKPTQMRVDIIDGDGRGSAAIWDGGTTVHGHEGGVLSVFKLTVDLHSKLATDLRGAAIDQGNFGALIAHLKSMDPNLVQATTDGDKTILIVHIDPASPEGDITKEVYILDPKSLPIEYYQYAEDKVVKHVIDRGLTLNIDFPPSIWQL